MTIEIEKVEGIEDDLAGIVQTRLLADGSLQQSEIGAALVIENDRLAI